MEEYKGIAILVIVCIVLLVVIAAPIIFLVRRSSTYKKHIAAKEDAERILAEYQDAGMASTGSKFLGTRGVEGDIAGLHFDHQVIPGGKNSPPRITLTADSSMQGTFTVRREGKADSFFKSIGFAGEAQTGDPDFDREFYLMSPSREYAKAMFAEEKNREAVRALFEAGFDRVEMNGGKFTASRKNHAYLLELAAVRKAVEQLAAMHEPAGALHYAKAGSRAFGTRHVQAACLGTGLVAGLGIMAAIWLVAPLTDGKFAPFLDTWQTGLSIYVALVILTVAFLRGRAGAATELALIALVALPGLWTIAVCSTLIANQYLDESPARTVETLLDRKYTSKSRDSTTYYLVFRAWREDRGQTRVPVSSDTYSLGQEGQAWILQTRAGRLGYEWIEVLSPKK